MRPASLLNSARTAQPGDLLAEVVPWLLVLLGVVIVGAIAVHILRPSADADERGSGSATGFSLQELRDLHASGELSDEEFGRARETLLERASASTSENSKSAADGGDEPSNGGDKPSNGGRETTDE